MENEADYRQGMVASLKNWGTLCSGQGDCSQCPVGLSKGANITCQEFAMKFPEMMANILEQAVSGNVNSYYNELCARFPNMSLPVDLVARAFCRKAMFEGNFDCTVVDDVSACVACWEKPCYGDVEKSEPESMNVEPLDITF